MWLWQRTIGKGRYWERPGWWLESVYPKPLTKSEDQA
jgi:hypothetical protein